MCQKCNKEILVDQGRLVSFCERHGDEWCSCKVRQFIDLLGLVEVDNDGNEIRFITNWFPTNEMEHE